MFVIQLIAVFAPVRARAAFDPFRSVDERQENKTPRNLSIRLNQYDLALTHKYIYHNFVKSEIFVRWSMGYFVRHRSATAVRRLLYHRHYCLCLLAVKGSERKIWIIKIVWRTRSAIVFRSLCVSVCVRTMHQHAARSLLLLLLLLFRSPFVAYYYYCPLLVVSIFAWLLNCNIIYCCLTQQRKKTRIHKAQPLLYSICALNGRWWMAEHLSSQQSLVNA